MSTGLSKATKRWTKYWKGVKRPASETARDWAPIGLGVANLAAGLYTSSKNREADEAARADLNKYRESQLGLSKEEQSFREDEALKEHARLTSQDFEAKRARDLDRAAQEEHWGAEENYRKEALKASGYRDVADRFAEAQKNKEMMERYDEDRDERAAHNRAMEKSQEEENQIRMAEAEARRRASRGDDDVDKAVRSARTDALKTHNEFDARARKIAAHMNRAEAAGFLKRDEQGNLVGTNDPVPGYIINPKTGESGTAAQLANEATALEAERAALPNLDESAIRRQVDPRIEEHEQALQHYATLAARAQSPAEHESVATEAMQAGIHPDELSEYAQRLIDEEYQQRHATMSAPPAARPAGPSGESNWPGRVPSAPGPHSFGGDVGQMGRGIADYGQRWASGVGAAARGVGGGMARGARAVSDYFFPPEPTAPPAPPSMAINPAQDYGGAGAAAPPPAPPWWLPPPNYSPVPPR